MSQFRLISATSDEGPSPWASFPGTFTLPNVGDVAERHQLRAGDLTAELVGADLFAITWRGTEVLQRLYYAVRDAPWNTIPGQLVEVAIEHGDDRFAVRLEQRHRHGDIDLVLHAAIEGHADGTLLYRADTRCDADFAYSKIGLNLHHGLDNYRGRRYRASTAGGVVEGVLEEAIVPQLICDGTLTAMFAHFDAIDFELGDVGARFAFEGERFETQDHRNWCDANWKTYGTPLEYGFPMQASAGQRLWQEMRLGCSGGTASSPSAERPALATVTLGGAAGGRLPALGVSLDGVAASADLEALRALRLAFVRHTIAPERSAAEAVTDCLAIVDAVGAELELMVLTVPDQASARAAELVDALLAAELSVARIVVLTAASGFSEFRGAAPPDLAAPFAQHLAERGATDVAVFSGSGQSYNVICRDRPDYPDGVGIAFAVIPQIHASDDVSVMQNAGAVGDVVDDCRRLYPGRAVAVTPVHLAAAEGPYPSGPPQHDDERPQDDPRHASAFGAAWAVAALTGWSQVGAESVTLFDGFGGRGVLDSGGELHPVGAILAALGGRHGADVRPAEASDAGAVAVLDVDGPDGRVVLVANLRGQAETVRVRAAPKGALLRVVDDLDRSGTASPTAPRVVGDDVVLTLRPWAVAVLEPG